MKSFLKLLLKVGVTGVCLWYVSRKINWLDTLDLLLHSKVGWLLLAALLFVASKWISAIRLNLYFNNLGFSLSGADNLRLYWLGMFYNLFLPGGIGGDAYKVILLKRIYKDTPTKKITAAVLLDRVSGVAGLGILSALFFALLYLPGWYASAALVAIVPALYIYYLVVKRFFPSFLPSFYATLWLGLLVQCLQVLCVFGIMLSIDIRHDFAAFQFLFLLSSIVAIFPFTIGGLGAREVVFLWGSQQYQLQSSEAVFISLLFYIITLVVSLVGVIWVYKNPLQDMQTPIQTPTD